MPIETQDPEVDVESEVLRASLRLCRNRYPSIHLAADVLSGLARYQDTVAVKAVDAVLEAIRRGIEVRASVCGGLVADGRFCILSLWVGAGGCFGTKMNVANKCRVL